MIKAQTKYESHIFSTNAKNCKSAFRYMHSTSKKFFLPQHVFFNSLSASSPHERAEQFNDYFYSVYQSKSVIPESFNFSPSIFFPSLIYCEEDIFPTFCSLDSSKNIEIDNIGPRLLKSCAFSIYDPITLLLQKCIHLDPFLRECKVPLNTPIL